MKNILALESPNLRFEPAYPDTLIPDTKTWIYNNDNTIDALQDTVTYKIVLMTPANIGGDKKPHGTPEIPAPRLTNQFVNPDYPIL